VLAKKMWRDLSILRGLTLATRNTLRRSHSTWDATLSRFESDSRERGLLFQVSGPVGDQGEGFADGLRENGVHHEFLAVSGSGVASRRTAHGGGFEQGVGRAQLQVGAVLLDIHRHHLLVKRAEVEFFAVIPPVWSPSTGG